MSEPGWTDDPMGISVPATSGLKVGEIVMATVPVDPLDGHIKPGHPRAVMTEREFIVRHVIVDLPNFCALPKN